MKETKKNNELLNTILKTITIGIAIYVVFFFLDPFGIKNKDTNEKTVNNQTKANDSKTTDYTSDVEYGDDVKYDRYNSDKQNDSEEDGEVFFVVEDMPKYKGCEDLSDDAATQCTMGKIQAYIAKIDYPQIAMDNDIEGKVYVSFVVDKTGSVSEVKLLRSVDKLLDNAALKHIKNMPKFASPGKQRGKPVRLEYKIPISFQLQ